MEKMTSAYANKMIRRLEEEKEYWLQNERDSSTYVAAVNEAPVVPDYNYEAVAEKLTEIDGKIAAIKHSLNLANATARVKVDEAEMSVDTILIKMAQLNNRKNTLDIMRKALPKSRVNNGYSYKTAVAEYMYTNYDPKIVNADYETAAKQLMELQMALDSYNQSELIEVDV